MSSIKFLLALCASGAALSACSPSVPTSSSTTTTATAQTAPYSFTGHVLQAGTSTGIAAASVTLVDPSGIPASTTTDSGGVFSFSGLATSGTYTIQTVATGYVPSTAQMAVPVTNFTIQLIPLSAVSTAVPIVTVNGPTTLPVGAASQFSAIITRTDGSTVDATTVSTWSSANPAVASVSPSGLVTAYASGVTVITANFQSVSGSLGVTVP